MNSQDGVTALADDLIIEDNDDDEYNDDEFVDENKVVATGNINDHTAG